uniref:Calponin-homology (CH) domain-containing protein n=1 Tax=Salarias fasciatus TaxID=181472 RepID=A0A672GHH7_SALFA
MDDPRKGGQEETVSEALGHFQATLQAAVREVHVDVSAFKQRIEQKIEEVCVKNGPLAEAVSRLQEENLQLRARLEALSRLVEGLSGVQIDRSPAELKASRIENGHVQAQPKTQEEQRAVDKSYPLRCSVCFCAGASGTKEQPGSLPHLPLTALTKSSSEGPAAPKPDPSAPAAPAPSGPDSQAVKRGEYPFRRGIIIYSFHFLLFPLRKASKPGGVEFKQDLMKSQTLPRSNGAQAKRAMFERMNSEPLKPKDSKPKLKRSQSFGVSSASGIKQILLEWCRSKTIGYQNIDIQNFSSSWSDGMAFCALVHSFFPLEFDYNALNPSNRKHNLQLAFTTAEEQADCLRLIEVDDMLEMGDKPDPMCVFTYVQSLYNHLKKFE